MSKAQFRNIWFEVIGNANYLMMYWKEHPKLKNDDAIVFHSDLISYYNNEIKKMKNITATEVGIRAGDVNLCTAKLGVGGCVFAPLPVSKPCPVPTPPEKPWTQQYYETPYITAKEGINPMATTNTATSISLTAMPVVSEISKARDYLVNRLSDVTGRYEWSDPMFAKLRKQFNLDAPKIPSSSQEIIDAFKNGRVEIDQKKVDKQTAFFKNRDAEDYDCDDCDYEDGITGRYFGVTFLDLPKPDRKGYDAAYAAYMKAKQDTKDTIMLLDPKDGLAALKALEAWTPTGAAN